MRALLSIPTFALVATFALLLLASHSLADNDTPENAEPLAAHNYISEYVNGTNSSTQHWYYLDIDRGQEYFIYFYGTGGAYNRTRMLYSMYGPDSYENNAYMRGERWYRDRQRDNNYWDLWHWICPRDGRYYFRFFAVHEAVGYFHCNISIDDPVQFYRFATDRGTLWWEGVNDQNRNDCWKIWLEAKPNNVEGVKATLTWTTDHALHLFAYDLVDTYEQNMLNVSYTLSGQTGKQEVIRFTASYTGWYYIRAYLSSGDGPCDYTLRTEEYSEPNDGDNDQANATRVPMSGTFDGSIEASKDMHDWYRMDLVKGDTIGISMQIMDPHNPRYNPDGPNYRNYFEIQVYDPRMQRVAYGRNWAWPVPTTSISLPLQSSNIHMDGAYYLRTSFSWSYGPTYDPTNTTGHVIAPCDYSIQITIPNRPPAVNWSILEDIVMLEDTTWWFNLAEENVSYIDLLAVFRDPEGGVLTFSALGDENVTVKIVDDRLTLKPGRDWFGEANITIFADDDSGNKVITDLHVIVVPVNDPPRVRPEGLEVTFLEDDPDEANRTFDLYDLFYDIDAEDEANLTFEMQPHKDVQVTIDDATGLVVLTLGTDVNGRRTLTFQATDTWRAHTTATVAIDILPVNDPPKPYINDTAVYTYDEGFMLETFDAAELLYDPDDDTLLWWFVEYKDPGDKAFLDINNEGKDPLNSNIVVTVVIEHQDWFGTIELVIACVDGGGLRGERAVSIVVTGTPDPPDITGWDPATNPTFSEGETFTFTVSKVADPDEEGASFLYTWLLKGPEEKGFIEVQNGSSSTYEMVADYTSQGDYILKVVVYDDDGLPCPNPVDWLVEVLKTNRPPEVTIVSPLDDATFGEGEWVELEASGSDPDEEDLAKLSFEWYDGERLIGPGRTKSIQDLKPGDHEITVFVKDPEGLVAERTVLINVKKKEEEPGFPAIVAVTALAALGAALGVTRGRGRLRQVKKGSFI
jgi:hypothetical protein